VHLVAVLSCRINSDCYHNKKSAYFAAPSNVIGLIDQFVYWIDSAAFKKILSHHQGRYIPAALHPRRR
jgi:hypothetical protein